ncbi:2,6-beta-D-fructofuranosidase [Capsulimonas corticalis]|uniref:2,6-beta-D-fructofuranosidase n=1 Tax=Capsulimonas corticalis TaxID=2219043 RepID=A0A402CSD7_9BACT|nr:glycoside hydrolase family 32 protein [Capsulimonas corticalis]BDI31120.1 2,6-beta-D-fructofuranosidase [Capsulimonas corticalis]
MTIDGHHNRAAGEETLYHESGRPQFHFTARRHWLNDPNGLVYFAGEYHLFFQHNPSGNNWGNMTWGHAVSADLVSWRQLDDAIAPDRLGTIYSGSAVVDYDNTSGFGDGSEPPIIAMYTAAGGSSPESEGQPFTQCLAYSNDRGRTWIKYAQNPVLPHVVGENRDPKVIWYAPGQFWVMALFLDVGNFALFTSPNLKRWTRIQTIGLPASSECPDFFPMTVEGSPADERWIIAAANGHYLVGRFDGRELTDILGPYVMDFGANFYAAQTFSDIPPADGRRIQMAWMAGGVYPGMPFNQQMSFPTVMTLHETSDGPRIFRNPVAEIETLVAGVREWRDLTVAPGENPMDEITSDLLDINAEILSGPEAVFGFRIGGVEIRYSGADRTLSCLGRSARRESSGGALPIRILADRTSIEIFADGGRTVLSFCITPSDPRPPLEFFAEGDPVRVSSLKVRTLRSSWPNSPIHS